METEVMSKKPSSPTKTKYENELNEWVSLEKAAIELIHVTGDLWFDKSVELLLFRNQLVDRSSSQILNLHHYAKNVVKKPINVNDTLMLAREMQKLDLAPSRICVLYTSPSPRDS